MGCGECTSGACCKRNRIGVISIWYTAFALAYVKLFVAQFASLNVKLESLTLRNHRITFSHSSKESLRTLTQRDKVDEEELSVEYLDISIIKISNNHGGNTFCKDNDLFPFSFF